MGTEYYRKLGVTLLHVSRTKVWLFTEGQSRVTKHIFEDQAIDHFHIDHNAPCLPPKFCIIIVSNFSWVLRSSQEKSKSTVMLNIGGAG